MDNTNVILMDIVLMIVFAAVVLVRMSINKLNNK